MFNMFFFSFILVFAFFLLSGKVTGMYKNRQITELTSSSGGNNINAEVRTNPISLLKTSIKFEYTKLRNSIKLEENINEISRESFQGVRHHLDKLKALRKPSFAVSESRIEIVLGTRERDPYDWLETALTQEYEKTQSAYLKSFKDTIIATHTQIKKQAKTIQGYFKFFKKENYTRNLGEHISLSHEDLKIYIKENTLHIEFLPLVNEATLEGPTGINNGLSTQLKSFFMDYLHWQVALYKYMYYEIMSSNFDLPESCKRLPELPLSFFPLLLKKRVRIIPRLFSSNTEKKRLSCRHKDEIGEEKAKAKYALSKIKQAVSSFLTEEKRQEEAAKRQSDFFYFSDQLFPSFTPTLGSNAQAIKEYLESQSQNLFNRNHTLLSYLKMVMDMSRNEELDTKEMGSEKDGVVFDLNRSSGNLQITLYPIFPLNELEKKLDMGAHNKEEIYFKAFEFIRHHLKLQEYYILFNFYKQWKMFCDQSLKREASKMLQTAIDKFNA